MVPVWLSGEFRVRPEGDGFVADVMGNDEADDIGTGDGDTPAAALDAAVRDYLHAIGPARAGRQTRGDGDGA